MKKLTDKEIDQRYPKEKAEKLKYKEALKREAPENFLRFKKAGEKTAEVRKKIVSKDRRRFLDLVSKAGVSTSLLRASSLVGGIMGSRYASAQDLSNKRVVYCYLNSGAVNGSWLPTSATNMNTCTQPYLDHGIADICNFREINVNQEGHANANQAIGVPEYGIPTMDQRLSEFLGVGSPYSYVHLGSGATTDGRLASTIGPCNDDPVDAFSRLFTGAPPAAAADTTYQKAFAANYKAINAIKNSLSQEERERLDVHAAALEKIEARIEAANSPDAPDLGACSGAAPTPPTNMQDTGKAQADNLVAALSCGLTRLGILQLGNHQGDWRAHGIPFTGDHHNAAHGVGSSDPFNQMIRYLSNVPAYFIKRLTETMGPDGQPLINTTVFVQVTCMGNGMDHSRPNAPFVVATRMPGFNSGFSASVGGTTQDLNGAIPVGLGLPDSAYDCMGGNNSLQATPGDMLGLVS